MATKRGREEEKASASASAATSGAPMAKKRKTEEEYEIIELEHHGEKLQAIPDRFVNGGAPAGWWIQDRELAETMLAEACLEVDKRINSPQFKKAETEAGVGEDTKEVKRCLGETIDGLYDNTLTVIVYRYTAIGAGPLKLFVETDAKVPSAAARMRKNRYMIYVVERGLTNDGLFKWLISSPLGTGDKDDVWSVTKTPRDVPCKTLMRCPLWHGDERCRAIMLVRAGALPFASHLKKAHSQSYKPVDLLAHVACQFWLPDHVVGRVACGMTPAETIWNRTRRLKVLEDGKHAHRYVQLLTDMRHCLATTGVLDYTGEDVIDDPLHKWIHNETVGGGEERKKRFMHLNAVHEAYEWATERAVWLSRRPESRDQKVQSAWRDTKPSWTRPGADDKVTRRAAIAAMSRHEPDSVADLGFVERMLFQTGQFRSDRGPLQEDEDDYKQTAKYLVAIDKGGRWPY